MSNDSRLEVLRALRMSQERLSYFLLGAAGAAIALAVSDTKGLPLQLSQIPLGLAVLCWALSFYFGMNNRRYDCGSLYTNATLLEVQAGIHPLAGDDAELMAFADETLREIFEEQSESANSAGKAQTALLIAGAVLYVTWHLVEMYLRTPAA